MPDFEHPLTPFGRGTVWHITTHFVSPGAVPASLPIHAAPTAPREDDRPIAERLMNVFHMMVEHEQKHIAPEKRPNAGLWEMVKHEFHGEFYRTMLSRDVDALAEFLRSAARTNITYGLGTGHDVYNAMANDGEGRDANIFILADRLCSVAEAIGVMPHENPEQGRYGINVTLPLAETVAAIEAKTGQIDRPPVMGLFGLRLPDGRLIDTRVPDDAYCAHRIGQIKAALGVKAVCEIGGGFGGLAFQTLRTGTVDRYMIVDLPSICVLQGYFLMKCLGGDAVEMFGEKIDRPRKVAVLPYWEFANRKRQFDLVVNRDSMPEMPRDRADEYVAEIVARGSNFLSVNQESEGEGGQHDWRQLVVRRLVGDGMKSLYRSPYWTRKGYVEELFIA